MASTLLAGCGADALSREDFVARAEERCRKVLASFPVEVGETSAGTAEINRRRAEAYRQFHADLRSLDPPESMSADFRQFLEKTRRQSQNRDEYAAAVAGGDSRQLGFLDEEFRAIYRIKQELRPKLGFKSC